MLFLWGGALGGLGPLDSHDIRYHLESTLPETNGLTLKIGHLKRKRVFQPSLF